MCAGRNWQSHDVYRNYVPIDISLKVELQYTAKWIYHCSSSYITEVPHYYGVKHHGIANGYTSLEQNTKWTLWSVRFRQYQWINCKFPPIHPLLSPQHTHTHTHTLVWEPKLVMDSAFFPGLYCFQYINVPYSLTIKGKNCVPSPQ